MITSIPYFGTDSRYLDLLRKWIVQHEASGCPNEIIIFSPHTQQDVYEEFEGIVEFFDITNYSAVLRPGQPFDIKGALMCELALNVHEPVMMLDADALLKKDYTPLVKPFLSDACAMPIDYGAILHGHKAKMDGKWSAVKKMCAGVFFLGEYNREKRQSLVAHYLTAWQELKDADYPWSPRLPHLLEQYAWSVAHHRLNPDAILPGGMNWAPHILDENPHATVYHYFGHRKWNGKAPKNT